MDTVTNLRTFLSVVQHASFSEAARYLHVVPSVVAKRVSQLEKTVGASLFERSTRAVRLTEAGHRLQTRALSLIGDFDDLVHAVHRDEGKLEGHIRLMVPGALMMAGLADALAKFLVKHDRITMDIVFADHAINPAEQAFDIVISGRTATFEGVVQLPLMSIDGVLCAAPSYLKSRAEPVHPCDLSRYDCLVLKPMGVLWSFHSTRGPIHVEVSPRIVADDNRMLLAAALQGLGIAILPTYVAGAAVARGELVPLLDGFPTQEAWYRAYVPRRSSALPRIKAVCQCIAETLKLQSSTHHLPASDMPKLERIRRDAVR